MFAPTDLKGSSRRAAQDCFLAELCASVVHPWHANVDTKLKEISITRIDNFVSADKREQPRIYQWETLGKA
jgi:hypothetical protein